MSQRCNWVKTEADAHYHDTEWGVPSHDDRHLFEMLILEGAQAGLSWSTILNKRAGYREAFADFDVDAVARFTPKRIEKLLENPGIVRNRAKVESAVTNARAVQRIREEHGSLAASCGRSSAMRRSRTRGSRTATRPRRPSSPTRSARR